MPPKKRAASRKKDIGTATNDNGDAAKKDSKKIPVKRVKKEVDDEIDDDSEDTAKDLKSGDQRERRNLRGNTKNVKEETDSDDQDSQSAVGDSNKSEQRKVVKNTRARADKTNSLKTSKGVKTKHDSDSENEMEVSDDSDDKDAVLKKNNRKGSQKKTAKGASAKRGKKEKDDQQNDTKDSELQTKTIVFKGKAPVDSYCTLKLGKAHVYFDNADVWDCMLNQTNLQHNNNKYYVIQLLEDDNQKSYSVWCRWGRVGNKGQNSLNEFGANLDRAKQLFAKKFHEKTKNVWESRHHGFEKVPGKYDLLKMDYSAKEDDQVDAKIKEPIKIPESKLDKRVQDVIQLICDVKSMEDTVMEMKYDTKKAPLGRLTTEQIKAGYQALKDIEELINNDDKGKKLLEACNNFYTRIPHNFGMKTPPLITTKQEILSKIQLLEILGDIEVAMTVIKEAKALLENPLDNHYKCLDCSLTPIDKSSKVFKMINNYLQDTHEKTHNSYKLELIDVFECCKPMADEFLDVGNRVLLWHGSRMTNWSGILKQGLRIAPPEAPVTGYMFGKGVYFADRSSKSANYCYATSSKNVGLLLLCEVALGNCDELLQSNYNADKLPKGKHSVKGVGMISPDPNGSVKLDDGTLVPCGKSLTADKGTNFALHYNEYIIYDTRQIKMRYLVKAKFDFVY